MPIYQGELDGLCGPYAIVNAFGHCGVDSPDELFETACTALAPGRWPKVLWEGTTIRDLERMIKLCRETVADAAEVRTSYPFRRDTPNSNREYWDNFDELLDEKENPNTQCVILGLTRPSMHWIVAFRETRTRISFVDTDPHRPLQRKNRATLYAGERNRDPNVWMIERSELILFETET